MALIKRGHRRKNFVDWDGTPGSRGLAQARLVSDRGPVGRPGRQNCALHFRFQARMPGNFKGMKKTGKWLRHCCASFPSRRFIVVRGATYTAANLGSHVSRVQRAFAMTKALKSGHLALPRAECRYFPLHPLTGKISFPNY